MWRPEKANAKCQLDRRAIVLFKISPFMELLVELSLQNYIHIPNYCEFVSRGLSKSNNNCILIKINNVLSWIPKI